MKAIGVTAGFLLLFALVYGAYYFSPTQRENREIRSATRKRLALEEQERGAGLYTAYPDIEEDR